VQRPWLPRRLSELLDSDREAPGDIATSKRGLHGCGRQTAFKIIKNAPSLHPSNDLQPTELRITHHQDGMIGIG
jgi:hypothetical protein